MSGDLIHRAFNDPEEIVRHNALKHPNVTTEHLHAAANHAYDDMMREYAKRILEVRE
jgi:dephospho-CoA kinase